MIDNHRDCNKNMAREGRHHGGHDASASSVAVMVVLLLAIPAVLLACIVVGVAAYLVMPGAHGDGPGPAPPIAFNPQPNLGEMPQPQPGPQPKPDVVQILPVPPDIVAKPGAPMPPPIVAGKRTIDLIPLIDPAHDSIENRKWLIRNNELVCDDGSFVPRLQIPYQPPAEYDFTVVFSQPGLRNGISLIMPNPNGGSFFWYLGAGGGSQYGFHANPNQGSEFAGLIQPKVPCTTTVQVRKNSVKGLVNGKELVTMQTDYRSLLCDGWRTIPDQSLLAVACDDPVVFHFVRVVEITGQGKRTR